MRESKNESERSTAGGDFGSRYVNLAWIDVLINRKSVYLIEILLLNVSFVWLGLFGFSPPVKVLTCATPSPLSICFQFLRVQRFLGELYSWIFTFNVLLTTERFRLSLKNIFYKKALIKR